MDFFASQDTARKHTKLLICYFVLAIVGLTFSLYGVVVTAEHYLLGRSKSRSSSSRNAAVVKKELPWWDPRLFFWSSMGTLTVVFLGSSYKTMQLSGGGRTVAKDLGGRLVSRDTQQTDERRLLNVVEEMALAAGMPVPDVYLMDDEDAINAFAAGHTPGDAVIGVSRGAMRMLSRDELQGVMAHEFSHILNGDMRMNLRLIGWVHGILVIALLGQIILRLAAHSGSRNEREGGARVAFLIGGAAIMAIGYLGVFFGNLIKAAISRQREFLADASAVQFTRNPDGIAGALKKIGGGAKKSYLDTAGVEIASHMLFGEGRPSTLFDSHPPLEERIRRIDPSWDGKYKPVSTVAEKLAMHEEDHAASHAKTPENFVDQSSRLAAILAATTAPVPGPPLGGNVSPENLTRAREIQTSLPQAWRGLLCDPVKAQAMMFALILSEEPGLMAAERSTLQSAVSDDLVELTLQLHQEVQGHSSAELIAVIDLAIPALRRLSLDEYQRFTHTLSALMESDQTIDLFEFMVQKILRRHLDLWFRLVSPPQVRFQDFNQLLPDAQIIISTLSHADGASAEEAQQAYDAARNFIAGLPPEMLPADLTQLDSALDRFEQAAPMLKRQLIHACGLVVLADRQVQNQEAELLRAIADTIGCPVPPLSV